ncbi:hypothetical protein Ancab_028263 [Ancistrocladus abbreviatus]
MTMIENRKTLNTSDIDGFDKVEVVLVDYSPSASTITTPKPETATQKPDESSAVSPASVDWGSPTAKSTEDSAIQDKYDVFSDTEADEAMKALQKEEECMQQKKDACSGAGSGLEVPNREGESEFKVMAADASVFTFGDEEDYERE